jgi:hypothetical protein
LDYARVKALIDTRQREDLVLEFKGMLPKLKDTEKLDRLELAKDVAAMANSAGGLILYGMHEHQECASKIEPVEGIEKARQRIIKAVSDLVTPIPVVEVGCLSSPMTRMQEFSQCGLGRATAVRTAPFTTRETQSFNGLSAKGQIRVS